MEDERESGMKNGGDKRTMKLNDDHHAYFDPSVATQNMHVTKNAINVYSMECDEKILRLGI